MKKLILIMLAVMMITAVTGCKPQENEQAFPLKDTFTAAYSEDISNMDYLVTASKNDSFYNGNFVGGLLDLDPAGNPVAALAESWDHNSDFTKWTFTLRKGVYWVTSTAEQYAEVTAADFVDGFQHALEFKTARSPKGVSLVENAREYLDGSITDFTQVGVKATDEYTVEYTLNRPYHRFDYLVSDMLFYPVNRQFLEAKGPGCKLGAPENQSCDFGQPGYDGILYNGAFIPTQMVKGMIIELQANRSYWDLENLPLKKCTFYFEDGTDQYAVIKGLEQGLYDTAVIDSNWEDFEVYKNKYINNIHIVNVNEKTSGLIINLNRSNYTATSHETEEDRTAVSAALADMNFRLALMYSLDRAAILNKIYDVEIANAMIRCRLLNHADKENLGWLKDSYKELTQNEVEFADGTDSMFNAEKVTEYLSAAETDGIVFPLTIDLACFAENEKLAHAIGESIVENTGHKVEINYVQSVGDEYLAGDFDIALTVWGEEDDDSETVARIMAVNSSELAEDQTVRDYLRKDDASDEDLVKMEAYLLSQGLAIPVCNGEKVHLLTKVVPGTWDSKLKYVKVQTEPAVDSQWPEN